MKRKSFENNEFQVLVIKLFAADSRILLTTKVFIEFRPTSSSDDLDTTFILKIQIELVVKNCFCRHLYIKYSILRPIHFFQIVFTLKKVSPHKSNRDCISNLLGKYAIYCLSHSVPPVFDLNYLWVQKFICSESCRQTQKAIIWQ